MTYFFKDFESDKDEYANGRICNESSHLHFVDQSKSPDYIYKSQDNTQLEKGRGNAIPPLTRKKFKHIWCTVFMTEHL